MSDEVSKRAHFAFRLRGRSEADVQKLFNQLLFCAIGKGAKVVRSEDIEAFLELPRAIRMRTIRRSVPSASIREACDLLEVVPALLHLLEDIAEQDRRSEEALVAGPEPTPVPLGWKLFGCLFPARFRDRVVLVAVGDFLADQYRQASDPRVRSGWARGVFLATTGWRASLLAFQCCKSGLLEAIKWYAITAAFWRFILRQ